MRRRNGKNIHGIVLLDKPAGITSNTALQKVKRLFQANKAGHTGSLDRQATGLLPLCLGEATKLSGYLLNADKRYHAICTLGITTTTCDAEGEVVETRPVPAISNAELESILAGFRGEIYQVPPMHSMIKQHGQPLYKLAHQGKEVERTPRPVTIYQLHLLDFNSPYVSLDVRCSKGTYIRTLAEDIGQKLGCGAHVSQLRRLEVTPFSDMVTLESLHQAAEAGEETLHRLLTPLDSVLFDWPQVQVSADSAYYLRKGQAVQVPRAPVAGQLKILSMEGEFLGIGEINDAGQVAPKRMMFY